MFKPENFSVFQIQNWYAEFEPKSLNLCIIKKLNFVKCFEIPKKMKITIVLNELIKLVYFNCKDLVHYAER